MGVQAPACVRIGSRDPGAELGDAPGLSVDAGELRACGIESDPSGVARLLPGGARLERFELVARLGHGLDAAREALAMAHDQVLDGDRLGELGLERCYLALELFDAVARFSELRALSSRAEQWNRRPATAQSLSPLSRTTAQLGLLTILTAVPLVQLSGLWNTIESMATVLGRVVELSPLRHFSFVVYGILIKGCGLDVPWPHVLTIVAFGTVLFALAVSRFHRQFAAGGAP